MPRRDDDDRANAPRRKKGNTGLIVGLSIGGGLLALLLVGCVAGLILSRPSASALPQSNRNTYLGGTADDWGPQLLDGNLTISARGADGLRNLGDDSLRWFLRGLDSDHYHVRMHSVFWMDPHVAAPYRSVFEGPLIRVMERDPDLINHAARHLSAMKSEAGKRAFIANRDRLPTTTRDRSTGRPEPTESFKDEYAKILAHWGE